MASIRLEDLQKQYVRGGGNLGSTRLSTLHLHDVAPKSTAQAAAPKDGRPSTEKDAL
jgi:hypothetical protein